MINILGINAYHADSSACVLKDGKLVLAIEEERLNRIKHWAGFPSEAIKTCLKAADLQLQDIDYIAFNSNPYKNLAKKVFYVLKNQCSMQFVRSRLENTRNRLNAEADFAAHFPGIDVKHKFKKIEHHHAHLASAYYASDFNQACVLSVDGFGDFSSAAWGYAQGDSIQIDGYVNFPHSLGIFYQAITQYLGFSHYGDEYKVMGMAAYGNPVYVEQLQHLCTYDRKGRYALDLTYFLHHTNQSTYGFESGKPVCSDFFSHELVDYLGPARKPDEPIEQRHKDLACSAQIVYERAFFNLCHRIHEKFQSENLALAGGCAMNSLANGAIADQSPFRNVYIQAASGDAGGALGAAFAVAIEQGVEKSLLRMSHAYWGPSYLDADYEAALAAYQDDFNRENCLKIEINKTEELCSKVAKAIDAGKVIGWFQGAVEWGPRALGNRSILADPRRRDMQDILNLKIKRRESFRPFAPSILLDQVGHWFEQDTEVPFMGQVFMIKEDKRKLIPAVTHVDGSGRLQTVSENTNALYYRLIQKFHELTGVPILLNTSFNENEPIVCTPAEAIECFLRTKMDYLVLGKHVIFRSTD